MSIHRTCRTCGEMFDPEGKLPGGYTDQCNQCSAADRETRYVGRAGAVHKGANIEIFRTNLVTVKAVLRRESVVGPTANLSLGNPKAPPPFGREE